MQYNLKSKHKLNQKAHKRNEAFQPRFEQDVAGSKGKTYTVTCESNMWSCTCPAFGWSGDSRTCKHITQIKKENGW